MADAPIDERECPFDLTELTADQRIVWEWAYRTGYLDGHAAGVRAADDEAAQVFRRAQHVTTMTARVEPESDEERRLRLVAQDEMRWRLWPEQMRREQERRSA